MPEELLSPTERDLAELAAAQSHFDGFLADLVDLAIHGAPTYVGMIVNGLTIFGSLSSGEKFAETVDAARAWLASVARENGAPEGTSEEEFEASLAAFSKGGTAAHQRTRDEQDAVTAEAQPYLDDNGVLDYDKAPGSLARRVMRMWYRSSLTLTDAQVVAPGQAGITRVPAMRVALAQVAAWWVVPLDSEGRASFTLFTDPDS